jgi:S1-C subfamily serine protease
VVALRAELTLRRVSASLELSERLHDELARCKTASYRHAMLPLSVLSRLATVLGGIPIPGCLEGSPAARAGIRYGDVLLSIDGTPTPSWTDFLQARRFSSQVTVRVFRQGAEFDVTMELTPTARSPRHVMEASRC